MKGSGIITLLLMAMIMSVPGSILATGTLKLVSYNIHGGVGSDGHKDLDRIALVLKISVPDVIVLNEVNQYFLGHNQDEQIAETMGGEWTSVFGKTFTKPLADYGNAILTRLPVVSTENWLLSDFPHQERRGLLRVTISKNDTLYHVFAVHMGLNARMRERHSHEILAIMRRHSDGHCILMGDFNEQRSRSPGTALANFASHLKDCGARYGLGPQVTFPSTRSFRRIDFIWIANELAATNCYVPTHLDARLASDHLPVIAEVIAGDAIEGNDAFFHVQQGLIYRQDFAQVPPSHTAPHWSLIGLPPKSGYIGGVAVIGNEHVWRQSSTAAMQFQYQHKLPTSRSVEVAALIKTISSGGGSWSMNVGGLRLQMRHEAGQIPQLLVTTGDKVILQEDLLSLEIDLYDWNRYRFVFSHSDNTPGVLTGSVFINELLLGTGEMDSMDMASVETDFITAGTTIPCEIYVDEVSIREGESGSSGMLNQRIIELDEKAPAGWLDWW